MAPGLNLFRLGKADELAGWLEGLWQDSTYAFRGLRRQPAFTAVAVSTLAIAIGANTAIFSFVDGVLLKPPPYPKPEEIVSVWDRPPAGGRNLAAAPNFLDWKARNTVFEHLAAARPAALTWTGNAEPQWLFAQFVSASYFDVFGVKTALGRAFAPEEDQAGHEVALLTHRLWVSRFSGDPNVLGRSLTLDGKPYTVIGILPAGSYDRGRWDVYLPLVFSPDMLTRHLAFLRVFGRLKAGISIERARSEMDAIAARIAEAHPDANKDRGVIVDRFMDRLVDDTLRRSLLVLLAAAGAVLLIGCANMANLMLARSANRRSEAAIRCALGAGAGRLVRQRLTESVMISTLGGAAGLLLAYGLMRVLQAAMPQFLLPEQAAIEMDWRLLAFTTAAAVLTGILFGLAPALEARRVDLASALKQEVGVRASFGIARRSLRKALIVAEIAIAFVLLAGTGVLLRSFVRLLSVETGFESANVITMGLPRAMGRDTDAGRLRNYYRSVLAEVGNVPGVREAALTSNLPLEGALNSPFRIAGQTPPRGIRMRSGLKIVSPSYFRALRMRLIRGRGLSEGDGVSSLRVAVINETMARRFFPGQDPVGKQILLQQRMPGRFDPGPFLPWQVTGVVADEKIERLDMASSAIYVSLEQSPIVGVDLLVRTAVEPTLLVRAVQLAIWRIDKTQALPGIRLLESIVTESIGSDRLRTFLLAIFAAIALLLAVVGVYGVVSYSVAQRVQEMGIRAAMGAAPADLIRLIIGEGMSVAVMGLLLGFFAALGLTRFLANLLFNTSPADVPTFVAIAGILALSTLVACYIPARRAARADSMSALRGR